jgi:acetolactate synthase-1/2/3 large subunit
METTGAEIIIRSLQEEKVEYIFGYPGGAVLFIYDELFKQKKIKHVLTRHEQGASHAADGYARSSGKIGVCLVTSGPGLTNAVTGIATAYMDSIPMVIISGQVPSHAIGLDAFQEADAVGITRSCTKYNVLVKRVEDIAPTIRKAFHIASTGRPGPVLVDIPKDLTAQKTTYSYPKGALKIRSYNPSSAGHRGQVSRAIKLIKGAKRLMVYSGGGVILGNAATEFTRFVKKLKCPVTNTLMGLGAYPATDKQFLGMPGMHGTYETNMAMQHCDVLVAVGARFDDRVIGDPAHFSQVARQIVHVDVDPSSISKRVKVDVPIVGEVTQVLKSLNEGIAGNMPSTKDMDAWWEQITKWQNKNCLRYKTKPGVVKPQQVIEALHKVTGGDAFVTSDVGQHQMWAAQYYKFNKPRRWINSGGLGTMGFGLPAAVGVQLAHPGAAVACVTGEASIMMCIQELSTCKQYRLPVKIINLNNRYMGMVLITKPPKHNRRSSQRQRQDNRNRQNKYLRP